MEPEVTAPAGNKKKIIIITAIAILAVVGAVLAYIFIQKDTP